MSMDPMMSDTAHIRNVPIERRRQESFRQSTNKGARSSGISQPLVPGGTETDRGTPFVLPLSSLSFEAGKAEALYGNNAFGSTIVAWAFCAGMGASVGAQSIVDAPKGREDNKNTHTQTHTHTYTYTPIYTHPFSVANAEGGPELQTESAMGRLGQFPAAGLW